jgi:alanine racemase
MRPVVSLSARILQTRTAAKGETCGYNATYTFPEKTAIATLALGYADGFLRSLSGKGHVYCNGVACPIRGRVSMDLTIVEIGHLAVPPQAGDYVEVLGPHQDADTLAASAGTIGYEILTSLGPRYCRVYTG